MYVSDVYVQNQLLCGFDFFNTGEESSCNFSCSLSFLFLLFAFAFHAKSFGVALLAVAWNTKSFSIDILVLCVCLYAKRFTNTILVFLRLRVTQKLCVLVFLLFFLPVTFLGRTGKSCFLIFLQSLR